MKFQAVQGGTVGLSKFHPPGMSIKSQNFPKDRRFKFWITGASVIIKFLQDLDRLQRNRNKKQFNEIGLKSLIYCWVIFCLDVLLVYYNNVIRGQASEGFAGCHQFV